MAADYRLHLPCLESKVKDGHKLCLPFDQHRWDSEHKTIALLDPCPHCGLIHEYTFEYVLALNSTELALWAVSQFPEYFDLLEDLDRAESLRDAPGTKPFDDCATLTARTCE